MAASAEGIFSKAQTAAELDDVYFLAQVKIEDASFQSRHDGQIAITQNDKDVLFNVRYVEFKSWFDPTVLVILSFPANLGSSLGKLHSNAI